MDGSFKFSIQVIKGGNLSFAQAKNLWRWG